VEAIYPWIVFAHVGAGFAFAIAHGGSIAVVLRLREKPDIEQVRALLDLSTSSLGLMYSSLSLLIVLGVVAGFVGQWWGHGWIWAAIALLVLLAVAMYYRGTTYFVDLRRLAGLPYRAERAMQPRMTPDPAGLALKLASSRPIELAATGYLGLLAIIGLMVFKPF
jgi:hypothetical protein